MLLLRGMAVFAWCLAVMKDQIDHQENEEPPYEKMNQLKNGICNANGRMMQNFGAHFQVLYPTKKTN